MSWRPEDWSEDLLALCDRIRRATRAAMAQGAQPDSFRPVAQGLGDVVYAIDVPGEEEIARWARERSRSTPLSVLTEETGWLHFRAGELSDTFEHGGPRIAFDPVDGTRNLMADLRPAWTVVAAAGPGQSEPRLSEVELGIVSEIPPTNARTWTRLIGRKGRGTMRQRGDLDSGLCAPAEALRVDDDDRVDHGYFPFFGYLPEQRLALAKTAANFFKRLHTHEGADVRHCYDDQYICNAGQLVQLTHGSYRMIADLRASLEHDSTQAWVTSKPYDTAGAVLCAREAGCIIQDASGAELDYALDAESPVSFVGYVNRPTAERLGPHLLAAIDS